MKKYTIKDIAEIAGVSKGTVDRVIHNRGKVSKKSLDKVNNVLKEIDYKPNVLARNLKNNKSFVIAVFMPNPNLDSFWLPCELGIDKAISEYSLFDIKVKKFYFDPLSKKSFINVSKSIINSDSINGVLLAPLFQKEATLFIKDLEKKQLPFIFFNNNLDSKKQSVFVGQNLFLSGRVAARLIYSCLKESANIAIVHIDEVLKNATHMQLKEKGFRSYFKELNIKGISIKTFKLKQKNTNNLKKTIKYFIDTNPQIDAFFVTNSKVHFIANLLVHTKKNKNVVGYDLLTENIHLLKNGAIDFLINQNPKGQVFLGLTYLIEYFLFDKKFPNQKLLPIDIINSENVDSYTEI